MSDRPYMEDSLSVLWLPVSACILASTYWWPKATQRNCSKRRSNKSSSSRGCSEDDDLDKAQPLSRRNCVVRQTMESSSDWQRSLIISTVSGIRLSRARHCTKMARYLAPEDSSARPFSSSLSSSASSPKMTYSKASSSHSAPMMRSTMSLGPLLMILFPMIFM